MTSNRLRYLIALLAVTLLAASPLRAQTYDDSLVLGGEHRDDIKTLPLSTALDLVLQAQLGNFDTRYILAKTAHAGDSTHIPVLKQIAQAYGGMTCCSYSYQALYAALQLGEPVDYFINLGIQTAGTWQSYRALHVAAMRPDSASYQQILPLRDVTKSGSGVNAYETVLQLKAAYAQMPLQEEIDRSLVHVKGTFRLPTPGGASSHQHVGPVFGGYDLEPTTVWAREHLAEIAEDHPAEVRAAIDELVQVKAGQFPAALQEAFRDHLYGYAGLDPEARPPGSPTQDH
ncbi:MAG: hypothetical protein GVY18_07605 [Bacteroidetes bacterium]|nr:hypothetical protein [Bacteroidota bacterium]